jgi:hypothetical protein
MVSTQSKIEVLSELGIKLTSQIDSEKIEEVVLQAVAKNSWFTMEHVNLALNAIIAKYLNRESLIEWCNNYKLQNLGVSKKVGLVLAGNIPMVGFHDILSTFMCNHISLIKYSSKDDVLIPFLIDEMISINPSVEAYFKKVDKLKDYDSVLATGGNNTSKYFEYYFKNVPNIIRKSRSAIAVLTGRETEEELELLGRDIFSYFGLGCRSVSKVFIPKGYDLSVLLKSLDRFREIINHNKYKNNFDYNMALFLLNKEHFLHNDCLLMIESEQIASRIACLHYEYYDDEKTCEEKCKKNRDQIQCIVSREKIEGFQHVSFGHTQIPNLLDYADGEDTVQFLLSI